MGIVQGWNWWYYGWRISKSDPFTPGAQGSLYLRHPLCKRFFFPSHISFFIRENSFQFHIRQLRGQSNKGEPYYSGKHPGSVYISNIILVPTHSLSYGYFIVSQKRLKFLKHEKQLNDSFWYMYTTLSMIIATLRITVIESINTPKSHVPLLLLA